MKAFPKINYMEKMEFSESYICSGDDGMTLLDYFAAQYVSGGACIDADSAYKVAAAMMRERNRWDHETGERKEGSYD